MDGTGGLFAFSEFGWFGLLVGWLVSCLDGWLLCLTNYCIGHLTPRGYILKL